MNTREEFERWANENNFDISEWSNGKYNSGRTVCAAIGWNARQPEIDALKAELRMLRDGIQTMGDALADGVWAHLISSDDDLNALDAGISSVVGKLTATQSRLKSALMRDAISDIQNVERVEVFPVYTQDDKLRKAAEQVLKTFDETDPEIQGSLFVAIEALKTELEKQG